MIGFLRGKVAVMDIDCVLLDVHGVGYRIFISEATRKKLSPGIEVQLFTYLSVREDALILFGFYEKQEYDLFLHLISVSGIGPKVALGILSSMSVENFCRAINEKSASMLTKLPGIGKKSAERLILELHDKLSATASAEEKDISNASVADRPSEEAAAALESLGYSQQEILSVLPQSAKGLKTTQEIIKSALKALGQRMK